MKTQTNGALRDGSLTSVADAARRRINRSLDDTRGTLGQFMTPAPIANFMAGMFRKGRSRVRILDPGAGVGTLTAALVERLLARQQPPREISAVCYEIDSRLFEQLERTLAVCHTRCGREGVSFAFDIRRENYIESRARATGELFGARPETFDCVVMNPPYRKINSQSETRLQLRTAGIETSNLYSAFMLLGARQLEPQGEFVSISPRSFCNGPYFRVFRRELLRLLDLGHIHVFESRTDAFKEDDVLQENVIVYGVRQGDRTDRVEVSVTDATGVVSSRIVPSNQIVRPHDPETVIHIVPHPRGRDVALRMHRLPATLDSLGISVSTGRVVDFRVRQHLRSQPAPATAPLIYPAHFHAGSIRWPNGNTRKPNAIIANGSTADLLVPNGFYVLTKRFSAKEERRRVVAALYDPRRIIGERVGFDNKVNYFHLKGTGMDERLARGLACFLNSSVVDEYFRQFSGHTQVNAADLRRLPYPSAEQLRTLGETVTDPGDHEAIDERVARLF
jgi:adenine-specific DNA-methyltransferase